MPNHLARLFYLGNRYHGSQYQQGLPTVQGELIEAISEWSGEHHSPQTVQLAGRTDKGVHSIGQLVMITTERNFSIDKINRHLPDDIIMWASIEAPLNFTPRHDVLMRHYRYYLDKAWTGFNLSAVKRAASLLAGSYDFNQLAKPDGDRSTITTILNISIHEQNSAFFLDIFGTRFLWKLIRKMVTLLTEIGNGRIKFELITDLLSGKPVLPSGIKPAPPENLVLVETVVPFRMKSNKNAVRMIRKEILDQLERYKRSIKTMDNIIDHFSDPRLISQRLTKSQNQSGS